MKSNINQNNIKILKVIKNNTLEDTINEMKRLAHDGATDMVFRELLRNLFKGLASRDYSSEILAIYNWVWKNIRYQRDIGGVELLRTPRNLLDVRCGDCDDMAMLIATMLMSSGVESRNIRYVIIDDGKTRYRNGVPITPINFVHVFTQVKCGGQWVTLDPVANTDTSVMLNNLTAYREYPL